MHPIISWFSAGATSAIASYIACREHDNVRVIYIHLGGEHPDNLRFCKDCEDTFGYHVEIVTPSSFKSHWDVIEAKKFLSSPYGAPCTKLLKKDTRYRIEDSIKNWDGQIFGFSVEERMRAKRFVEQYPATKAMFPLIEHQLSKSDCLSLLKKFRIELPMMYRRGFRNNNCIGCVKGGKGYWSRIRTYYPSVFMRMAKLERTIGHSCISGMFLDELPLDFPMNKPEVPECSIFCQLDFIK